MLPLKLTRLEMIYLNLISGISPSALYVVLFVEGATHLVLFNHEQSAGRNRGCRPDSNGLTCQAPLTKEIARSQNCHDSLLAGLIDHRRLYTTLLNIHDGFRGVALCEDRCFYLKLGDLSCH